MAKRYGFEASGTAETASGGGGWAVWTLDDGSVMLLADGYPEEPVTVPPRDAEADPRELCLTPAEARKLVAALTRALERGSL
jgi:hypothetical protein